MAEQPRRLTTSCGCMLLAVLGVALILLGLWAGTRGVR